MPNPIVPCLWFNKNAEDAVNFYLSIFKDGKIKALSRYGEAGHDEHGQPAGQVMTISFTLNGQEFLALNGGPDFTFSHATSFIVFCDTQDEIDHYWDGLLAGGKAEQCGWLLDKFGLPWQIVPRFMEKLMNGGNSAKTERLMKAMLGMVKLDIAALEKAYNEE